MYNIAATSPRPEDFESWLWNNIWKVYKFHYTYYQPYRGPDIIDIRNSLVSFSSVELFICYLFHDDCYYVPENEIIEIDEDIFILNLSTTNSGHSLDEAASFISFYQGLGIGAKVGINSFIVNGLPHVYQFVRKFISDENIVLLNSNSSYKVKRCFMRRNTHYNYVKNWEDIPYVEYKDRIVFNSRSRPVLEFTESIDTIQELSREIWRANSERIKGADIVMLCKTTDELLAATPKRAMHLSPERRGRLIEAGIHILSPSQTTSFDEYVARLHGCKIFITSYGAAACTNRFFVHPDARVIVLANRHYHSEYAEASIPPYRHLRQTHLFPVSCQEFIIDHNDVFDNDDIENLIKMASV